MKKLQSACDCNFFAFDKNQKEYALIIHGQLALPLQNTTLYITIYYLLN